MKMPERREFFAGILGAIGGLFALAAPAQAQTSAPRRFIKTDFSQSHAYSHGAADDTKGVTEFFKGDDLKAVDRENVIRLIPRLKAI